MSITEVTHRGIRWQRDSQERIRWRNDDQDRWVRWRPGDDAPPRPPGWDRSASGGPPPLSRPAWRSPYRLIPVALVIIVLVLGFLALRSKSTTTSAKETAQANAFVGQCLAKVNKSPSAGYGSKPVACTAATAAGKVVAVVTWDAGSKACPANTTPAILTETGVTHPHFDCIAALPGL